MIDARTVPLGRWRAVCEAARAEGWTAFDLLTAVDQLDDSSSPGIDVVLRLRRPGSPGEDRWVRTRWHEGLALRSVADLWPGAAWRERELAEMFGLRFDDGSGRPATPERLLLHQDHGGYPLRKSFALPERAQRTWPGVKDPDERKRGRTRAAGTEGAGAP